MIEKNVKVGNVTCDTADFGFGRIAMQPAFLEEEKKPVLLMKSNFEGRSVGDESDEYHGRNSDEFNPQWVFIFHNEEGLQALIDSIEDCRQYFKNDNT